MPKDYQSHDYDGENKHEYAEPAAERVWGPRNSSPHFAGGKLAKYLGYVWKLGVRLQASVQSGTQHSENGICGNPAHASLGNVTADQFVCSCRECTTAGREIVISERKITCRLEAPFSDDGRSGANGFLNADTAVRVAQHSKNKVNELLAEGLVSVGWAAKSIDESHRRKLLQHSSA